MLIEEVPLTETDRDFNLVVESLHDLKHPALRYTKDLQSIESSTATGAISINYELIKAISLHANPNLAWCSQQNSQIVQSIINKNDILQYITPFINQEFRPNLRKVEKQANSSKIGKLGGLRPHLSFFQDQKFDLVPLAQAWFLLEATGNKEREVNMLVLLLLIDDFHFGMQGQIQACHMVRKLKILTPNLVPQLRECLKKCLLHIPPVTEETESLNILQVAFPCLYKVDDEYGNKSLNFIDTIASILKSLNYVVNHEKVMIFLLEQLQICVKSIGKDVLVSISKIFYMMNQIIVNFAMIEKPNVILAALKLQSDVLQVESPLVYSFVYDLVGAYTVLLKRLLKYKVAAGIQEQIKMNLSQLEKLAEMSGKLDEFSNLCTYIQ